MIIIITIIIVVIISSLSLFSSLPSSTLSFSGTFNFVEMLDQRRQRLVDVALRRCRRFVIALQHDNHEFLPDTRALNHACKKNKVT
jgi:hypothetical protein